MSETESTTSASDAGRVDPPVEDSRELELRHVCDALRGLKFGTVTLIVQDGVVVQIDRTEKRRLARAKTPP
jgi:hypothetical protein